MVDDERRVTIWLRLAFVDVASLLCHRDNVKVLACLRNITVELAVVSIPEES